MNKEEENKDQENQFRGRVVHLLLVRGYLMFFIAVILGSILDLFININFFQNPIYSQIGIIAIMIGTAFIYFAQTASNNAGKIKIENATTQGFEYGPYKYFRHPTYLGLFIMTLGLGLILNSLFSVIFVIIAHIFIKLIFIKKEEKLLEVKYGQVYRDYKKKVKNWI